MIYNIFVAVRENEQKWTKSANLTIYLNHPCMRPQDRALQVYSASRGKK